MVDAEGSAHHLLRRRGASPLRRFELDRQQQETVASWRVFSIPGDEPGTEHHVSNDPTSEELEPDLRRFEREGDPGPTSNHTSVGRFPPRIDNRPLREEKAAPSQNVSLLSQGQGT